jgi:hypothetical protein
MIDFQNLGLGDLGAGAKTFSDGGASITAEGFSASGPVDLWAKVSGSPSETGLGLANDSAAHEILPGSFVQLDLGTLAPPGSTLTLVVTGSIQSGESAEVFHGTTSGTLGGSTTGITAGSVSGEQQSYTITGLTTGFLDITAGAGNILLDSVTVVTPNVPDGGTTIVLLGGAITALGLIRRKLMA